MSAAHRTMSNDSHSTIFKPAGDTIKLRGEIIFAPTNEVYTEGDPDLHGALFRTGSINLFLWDERLQASGLQFLPWRCSHEFIVTVQRDEDGDTHASVIETILQFDPTPDTSLRTLRAVVDVPMPIKWTDRVCIDVSSNGRMPVHDIRGVVVGFKNMQVRFIAFGEDEHVAPKLRYHYKDETWNRDYETLARHHLDLLVIDRLEEF